MIGVLDSGVGGLSVYSEIKRRLPDNAVIYLADKKNFPFGEKSEEELTVIVRNAITKLIDMGANIVVLACNSATIATISAIRLEFAIPIIGIEPAVKQAAMRTKNNKIGVLATARTTEGHDGESLAPHCMLYKSHNATLIAQVENDYMSITDEDLKCALKPLVQAGVDSVVLGCTHYHFLKSRLEGLYPRIDFYTPEEAVANQLEVVIESNNVEFTVGNDIFLCSADPLGFRESLINLLGIKNADIRKI